METIALVANTSWSMYNFRIGLIRSLKANGYKVLVVAPQDNFSAALIAEGVEFVPVPIHNYSIGVWGELQTLRALIRIYKKYKPELIFHYTIKANIYGTLAANYCSIPSVAVITGLGHTFSNAGMLKIVVPLYRFALKRSRSIWFLNEHDKQVFIKRKIGKPEKMRVIPGEGVDTDYFYASKKRSDLPLSFLYAGRMLKDKGVNEFAQAAAIIKQRYPETIFRMVGFVDQYNPNSVKVADLLAWQAADLIIYMGESTDIRPSIDEADCVVLPSYYGEGLSRTLLEACSMAKPVITSKNVGCAELVQEGINGYLCEVRNAEDLARQMEKMIALSESERQAFGQESRKLILGNYEDKNIIPLYLQYISGSG